MDKITLKAGTLIHLGGFPFSLLSDTVVLGRLENFKMYKRTLEESNDTESSMIED